MTEADVLEALLIASVMLSIALVIVATAAMGRLLADLEYMVDQGLRGVKRIQVYINLRGQLDRVLLGVVFTVINVLLLAGAPEIWRMWTNRVLWLGLLAVVVVSSVLDWFASAKQVRLLMTASDEAHASRVLAGQAAEERRNADLKADIASYRQMVEEAVANLETAARHSGGTPAAPLVPVLPEHQSPVTESQEETARVATMRARLVAANSVLGIEPGQAPPHDPRESVDVATIQPEAAQAIADAVREAPPASERGD